MVMMAKKTLLVIGGLFLVQMVVASKYNNEALYLPSNSNDYSKDSGSSAEIGSLFSLPDFLQSGPTFQVSGGASVPAAIQSKRTVEVKPVNIPQDPIEPHVVDVEATYQPVHVVFRSSSSPVMVQQIHTPAQPAPSEPTQSEDEPHRVRHQVMRPIIQEVREIIQPYRQVLQEVRPVLEQVHTVVARSENQAGRSSGASPSSSGSPLSNVGSGSSSNSNAGNSALSAGSSGSSDSYPSGSGSASSSSSSYAASAAAASAPAPSFTRGRRTVQRKSYSRRVASAKRQPQLYSTL